MLFPALSPPRNGHSVAGDVRWPCGHPCPTSLGSKALNEARATDGATPARGSWTSRGTREPRGTDEAEPGRLQEAPVPNAKSHPLPSPSKPRVLPHGHLHRRGSGGAQGPQGGEETAQPTSLPAPTTLPALTRASRNNRIPVSCTSYPWSLNNLTHGAGIYTQRHAPGGGV